MGAGWQALHHGSGRYWTDADNEYREDRSRYPQSDGDPYGTKHAGLWGRHGNDPDRQGALGGIVSRRPHRDIPRAVIESRIGGIPLPTERDSRSGGGGGEPEK